MPSPLGVASLIVVAMSLLQVAPLVAAEGPASPAAAVALEPVL